MDIRSTSFIGQLPKSTFGISRFDNNKTKEIKSYSSCHNERQILKKIEEKS